MFAPISGCSRWEEMSLLAQSEVSIVSYVVITSSLSLSLSVREKNILEENLKNDLLRHNREKLTK
jgi:hypothetical protein